MTALGYPWDDVRKRLDRNEYNHTTMLAALVGRLDYLEGLIRRDRRSCGSDPCNCGTDAGEMYVPSTSRPLQLVIENPYPDARCHYIATITGDDLQPQRFGEYYLTKADGPVICDVPYVPHGIVRVIAATGAMPNAYLPAPFELRMP